MTDPAGSDRIQQGVPTASGTGADSDLATGEEDVPLTREEALARDAATDDDLPARADGDVARAAGSGPSGEVDEVTPKAGGGTER
jgi:hypothetical protein